MNALFIRADAGPKIGTGHVMRCLALGQAWQDRGGNVVFISHCESDALQKRIIDEGFDFIFLDKPHPHSFDIDFTIDTHHKLTTKNKLLNTWFVVDGYHFDSDYQKSIKDAGCKLLWIDDYGHADYYWADLILNQNISANQSMYISREPYTQLLIGTRFALLRREFKHWQNWHRKIPGIASKVLVTLGGSDPDKVTLKVIQALKQIDIRGLEVKIVVGPVNPATEELKMEIGSHSKYQILSDVMNMPELMAWAEIAVTAGGITSWEMAFMALPSLTMVLADNQSAVAGCIHDCGMAISVGWHNDISVLDIAILLNTIMKTAATRNEMAKIGRKYVDGLGVERVMDAMIYRCLSLRKASIEDCELLFRWVNDPDVRSSAFHSDWIGIEEHKKWFNDKLKDSNCIQFVAVDQFNRAIGQVRFDIKNKEAEIDVSVNKDHRGHGLGACVIRKGIDAVVQLYNIRLYNAHIKYDNQSSIRSFEQAGFRHQRTEIINGNYALYMSFNYGQD